MAGSGPAPNPASRRQTAGLARTWTELPVDGYGGEIPDWPLSQVSGRELFLWDSIWRTPQAAAWIRLGWFADVALYVRTLGMAEQGEMKAVTEVRLRSLELGLTPGAMLKNRWRIKSDEVETRRTGAVSKRKRRTLKVVDDARSTGPRPS